MGEAQSKPLELKPLPSEGPTCDVSGITPTDLEIDEEEAYRRACLLTARAKKLDQARKEQHITFSHGPATLCFVGDLHFGGNGVDYPKAFRDAEIIRRTPGMYAVLCGADLDNWIVTKLIHYQMDQQLTVDDQWALFRRWLRIIGPKLRLVVRGNHDAWNWLLTGVDYMRDVVASICPSCIYDTDDCRVSVRIKDTEWPGRVRHKWWGRSQYNPTHGAEKLMKWDGGTWVWDAGAHDHDGGCTRSANVGGIPRMHAKTWTYKFNDPHARAVGFPRGGPNETVCIVFDDRTNSMTGIDSLEFASWLMARLYPV